MKKIFLPILLLTVNFSFAQVDLNLGLKAYYPFSGNANDVSGNNNNPVFNNATLTADRFGNPNSAYHFDGSSQYMRILNSTTLNTTNKLTLVAWVRPQGFYAGTCHGNAIIMKGDADNLTGNYLMRYDDNVYTNGNNCFQSVDVLHQNFYGSGVQAVSPGYTPYIQINQWYSVIVTHDGTTSKLYVNCELKASTLQGSATFTNAYDLYIGRLNSGSFPYWVTGDIDEVRIYDRALTVDEVNVLGGCPAINSCVTWLQTPLVNSNARVGDLDISGNQLTVEANFNRTAPVNPVGGYGFLVSKHTTVGDINYALWPNGCAISTINGDALIQENCPIQLNKTYHVAMVYDGATLKFYRNGFLHSQAPASGNLVLNNLITTFAQNVPEGAPTIFPFIGYMNEVRIWNVARTQAQLQTYMNASLPNPTTQTGLRAYYTFDDLQNKQGNATYNATLNGAASINTTNPNCTFVADSCGVITPPGISNIINTYTPVLALNPCGNNLTVEDASTFNVGDTVLLIQMKGAVIDSTNTAAFGTITDYKNSGNYEFNYVKSKSGNIIELDKQLTRQYDIPIGKVQLIRVPYYSSLTLTDTLTCLPWDGSKGGVLVFNVQNTLTLNANINVSGKGFKGGLGYNPGNGSLTCAQNNYNYPVNTLFAAQKGESITTISNNILCGKGNPAGGGGGGLGHNSGGGGGGNGGLGGFGGYQLDNCGGAPFDNRGIGGRQLVYSTVINKIYLGSGGGAGHADNPGNIPPGGGNGAGIIIINADKIQSNTRKILANGSDAVICSIPSSPDCHDAMGGGGAGGTVLLSVNQYLDNTIIETKGGKGADVIGGPIAIAGRIGPGGGGAGGVTFLKAASLPANLTITNSGGTNGVLTLDANNPWGATPGNAGQNLFNLILPIDQITFIKNIDSVRIKDSLLNCNGFDFKGRAYFNTTGIASWNWFFGDGGTANTQNTSHAYAAAGTYMVKLVVTDSIGCKDSASINVNALPGINAEAGSDTSICSNGTVSVQLNGTAIGGPYLWSPAIYLNNPNIQNPVATISSTTTFYLNVTGASCTSIDSVTITINPLPLVDAIKDTAICRLSPLVLSTVSNAVSYLWSPAAYVSNPTIANPNYIDNFSHKVYVTGTSAAGCNATDSVDVTVNPLPVVQTIPDSIICIAQNITLTTTGAQTYSWSPAAGLNNPGIANPVFSGASGQTYTVTGTDGNGCKNTDQVTISISAPDSLKQPPSFSICQQQSVQLNGNNGTHVSYLWSPATYLSNATIFNPVANPPQTTVYSLLVTDNQCGFDSLFTTLLKVIPAPVINAGKSNDLDCVFKSARLFAAGGNQYLWSPSAGLSDPNISNPVATPANTQTYTVLVTDATGCTNTGSVTVFKNNTASLARYMPNAFTPNGDGKNDCYGLKNWMYVKQLQFYIFNRYGERVFATANPNVCWDGMYKGKPALAGTYVFVIKAQTDCGLEEQRGNFLLTR